MEVILLVLEKREESRGMVEIRMQRIARTCFSSSSFGRFSLRSRAVATMRRRAVEQRRDTRNDCSCDSIPFNMRASSHRCDTIRRYASVSADSSPTSSAPVPAPAPIPSSNYAFLHHVGILVSNLESTIHFYCEILGFKVNDDRPDDKLPYRGVWLDIGCTKDAGAGEKSAQDKQMIHIMELPNPDPMEVCIEEKGIA